MDLHWHLFFSTCLLMALSELPDKTALATVLMATRHDPWSVFLGVAGAFLVQTLVAVLFGSLLQLLPHWIIQALAAALFLVFAGVSWAQSNHPEGPGPDPAGKGASFWRTAGSAFMVIFIAEWGDLTQLATCALVAQTHEPLTIFLGALAGLWAATAFTVWLGARAKHLIDQRLLHRVSAVVFAAIGLYLIWKLCQGL